MLAGHKMEVDEIFYKEIVELRKDMKEFQAELSAFKIKMYMISAFLGSASGMLTNLLPFMK